MEEQDESVFLTDDKPYLEVFVMHAEINIQSEGSESCIAKTQ